MSRLSRRMKLLGESINKLKLYSANEAFDLLKEMSKTRFKESIDVAINLGVDPRKSDQIVRGSSLLPNGIGKVARVAVFAEEEDVKKAWEAGADIVGMNDLVSEIRKGNIEFDVAISSPSAMRIVSQLGPILGPRGLMPNPKVGTVTTEISQAVRNVKLGQVRYRVDKAGIVHTTIGKVDFATNLLRQNLETLMSDLKKLKPPSSKGIYIKKITVSSTMGLGLVLDKSTL